MVAPAQNVGAVVRRTLPKGGYEYVDRAESLGSVTHEMFIVGYTFGVRNALPSLNVPARILTLEL